MRAYHRVDPLMDERKGHYTPAQLGAFLKVQLVAGRQTNRGRFRSIGALKNALPAAYVRHVDHLVAEGDLVLNDDGSVYLDGWDEWQEGDYTVKDRMERLRNRRRNATVTTTVTDTVTRAYQTAYAHANADATSSPVGGVGGGSDDEPEFPVLLWLAANGCAIRPGNGYHQKLIPAVEAHGAEALIAQMERLAKAGVKFGDTKGFVWGAIDALYGASRPDVKAAEAEERASARSKASEARLWQQRERMFHSTGVWDAAWGPTPAKAVPA